LTNFNQTANIIRNRQVTTNSKQFSLFRGLSLGFALTQLIISPVATYQKYVLQRRRIVQHAVHVYDIVNITPCAERTHLQILS